MHCIKHAHPRQASVYRAEGVVGSAPAGPFWPVPLATGLVQCSVSSQRLLVMNQVEAPLRCHCLIDRLLHTTMADSLTGKVRGLQAET